MRFLPTTEQLAALDSIMDAQGLELFDTPVDFEVIYEGDYYQDPSIPDSLPTWQYAVVPPTFIFPAGITHQTLASIHIPDDDYTAVETEAERLAAIQDSLNLQQMAYGQVRPNTPECPPGYVWDFQTHKCVLFTGDCDPGYHWNGSECVPDIPPIQDPPPPAADAAKPAGNIYVHDTNLNTDVPVRNTRIVAKRWFKIERTYTDNNGHFQCTKRFKHKVKVNVKFKNQYASVRGMRGVRLWQMLFPVKKTVGVFSGDKSNITYIARLTQTFAFVPGYGNIDVTTSNKSTRYWAAATTLNTVQEYRDYAITEGIGLPSTGIKIVLSNWGHGSGATPMFAKRASNDLPMELISWYSSPPVQFISAIVFTLKHQIDILGSYNFGGFSDITSDVMKELFYHELTHCAHYEKLGNSWYTTLVNSELVEIISNMSSGYAPYGDGTNSQSAIIALGESWAYHIGHYFTNLRYGMASSDWSDQGQDYFNGVPISGLSSHLNLLENFSPYRTEDPFHWIPTGLYYDMMDARNDATAMPRIVNIDDQVSEYTNGQFYNAFSSSIYNLGSYKTNLLQQNSNRQSAEINTLFTAYDY